MSRLPILARAVAASALIIIGGACSEQLPRALDVGVAAADAPWEIDQRPVSETCRALALPAPTLAPKARIAYESLTTAPLKGLVDVVPHGGRMYVVERKGIIHYLASDGTTAPVVLDIGKQLTVGYDSGLLSLAFHPKFAQNGYVYLAYTVPHPVQPPPAGVAFLSVVGRFQSKDGGLTVDPTTEKRLLVRDQPTPNHNGNKLVFGKDGYLYFSAGDGGQAYEPPQDKYALFGKVLRLDVDSGDPYGIPPTNPYALGGGAPEVYAYGLRNPWRFSFDRVTGDLWLGDVGANGAEEINRIVAGGNYGWPIREGRKCFFPLACDPTGLIDPVAVHEHDGTADGAGAIIGGVVYRGVGVPALAGKYVYADYVTSNWWAFDPTVAGPAAPVRIEEGLDRVGPVSIDLDEKGEIVFVTESGRVYRVVAAPSAAPAAAPLLSDTGCVDKLEPTKPAPGLFAYDVNVPQWMDGAVAERFLSVPREQVMQVADQGRLVLPAGSVAMRTLRKESKLVETQLILRRPDSSWEGYTYAWSSDQKNARLVRDATTVPLANGRKHEIRPAECAGCHIRGAVTLGLEAGQLERGGVDPKPAHSALATLAHVGLIAAPVAPGSYSTLPLTAGNDTEERRARAYLHANCAFCHDGTAGSKLDLRFTSPRPDAQGAACTLAPSMRATGPGRMPPIGSTTPDEPAIRLLETWIGSLHVCP